MCISSVPVVAEIDIEIFSIISFTALIIFFTNSSPNVLTYLQYLPILITVQLAAFSYS